MSALGQQCSRILDVLSRAANTLAFTLVLSAAISVPQTANAQTFKLLYQFRSGNGGAQPFASLIRDSKGNLYGTTTLDGAHSYGTVFKISPAGKETVLYSFKGAGGDGANPVAPLVRDAAGNLYGTTLNGGTFGGDFCRAVGCGVVFKVTPAGKETVLHRFTGYPDDGQNPWQGLVRDSAGSLYGTTYYGGGYNGGTVFKVDPTGKETVLHGFGTNDPDGLNPLGGSLIRDSAGNLYGMTSFDLSQGAGTVFKLDPSGTETILYTFSFGTGDGYDPYGTLVRDRAGNLYGVTNFGGAFDFGAVFKLNSANTETLLYSFSGNGGDGAVPGGVVRDGAGNLYGTTNSGGGSYYGTVFKLDKSGKETILHSFSGLDGYLPDLGLVRDSKGNLYGTTQYGGAHGGGVVFKITP